MKYDETRDGPLDLGTSPRSVETFIRSVSVETKTCLDCFLERMRGERLEAIIDILSKGLAAKKGGHWWPLSGQEKYFLRWGK